MARKKPETCEAFFEKRTWQWDVSVFLQSQWGVCLRIFLLGMSVWRLIEQAWWTLAGRHIKTSCRTQLLTREAGYLLRSLKRTLHLSDVADVVLPEVPAALPEGKENVAERIILSDTCSCVTSVAGAARRFSGLAGCFYWSFCKVSSLGRVNVSSLAASRTAPRMSPSSRFSRMSFPLSFLGGKKGLFVPTGSVYSPLLKAAICCWFTEESLSLPALPFRWVFRRQNRGRTSSLTHASLFSGPPVLDSRIPWE